MLNFKTVNYTMGIALLCAMTLRFFIDFNWGIIIGILVTWLLLTVCGSGLIQWNYFFKSLHSNPSISKNQVAITFDDGPHPEYTPVVLRLLKEYHCKATFFCIGTNIEKHPELFQQITSQGHTVGNHTYSHAKKFGFFSVEKIISELNKATQLVKDISGIEMKLYRPAFGVTNPNIKKAIATTGHIPIGWNKRSLDTMPYPSAYMLKRITKNLKKGDVILLHDTSAKSIALLEQLLVFLQRKELKSVPVNELLKIKPYA